MKLSEIREMTAEELTKALNDTERQIFDLRMQNAGRQLDNTAQIGQLKHHRAQIKTVQRQQELAATAGGQ